MTETTAEPEKTASFHNPVSQKSMPDPFITYYDGYYYGLATEVTTVKLYKCERVEDLFIRGKSKELIKTGDDIGGGKTLGGNCWAPELHYLPTTGRWYVYFCASTDGFDFGTMRMHCLESEGSDPFGDYVYKGATIGDQICIDQTVYYDEASGCWSEWYCLGCLRYTGADTSRKSFLDPDNWEKSRTPLFKAGNEVYGVGHCSFFSSPDGSETWMAYHGMPVFGAPLPREAEIAVPSGQKASRKSVN